MHLILLFLIYFAYLRLLSPLLLRKLTNGNGYLEWKQYAKKFGWISVDKIRDKQRISSYITKYINKGVASTIKEYGANLYYCSKGLKTGEVIGRYIGQAVAVSSGWDYVRSDGFYKVKWYDSAEEFARDFNVDIADPCEENARGILEKIGVYVA